MLALFAAVALLVAATPQQLRRPALHEASGRSQPGARGLSARSAFSECSVGTRGCKSVCKWLGFSNEDESFEKSSSGGPPNRVCTEMDSRLKDCGYVSEDRRAAPAEPEPLDCIASILHSYALESQLESEVDRLIVCFDELPAAEKSQCHLVTNLLDVELSHWQQDSAARAQADALREQLGSAMDEARTALEDKARTREVMSRLSETLAAAEEVPGFYLRETIHSGRRLLEQLSPVALVLEELARAEEDGRRALDSKDGYACEQAILRLGVAMNKAEKIEVRQPLAEAQALEADLERVSSAAEELNAAIVQANSSQATATTMGKSLSRLSVAMDTAKGLGITRRVRDAEEVFTNLFDLKMAFVMLKAAIVQGEAALDAGSGEGLAITELEVAMNSSKAVSLHKAMPGAVSLLHELMHLQGEHQVEEIPDIHDHW